jgi:Ca2+/Na+ antiporter
MLQDKQNRKFLVSQFTLLLIEAAVFFYLKIHPWWGSIILSLLGCLHLYYWHISISKIIVKIKAPALTDEIKNDILITVLLKFLVLLVFVGFGILFMGSKVFIALIFYIAQILLFSIFPLVLTKTGQNE